MSSRVDSILDLIDVGLQSSTETGYGARFDGCVRCSAECEEGDLCGECRGFLLGDSDKDPIAPAPSNWGQRFFLTLADPPVLPIQPIEYDRADFLRGINRPNTVLFRGVDISGYVTRVDIDSDPTQPSFPPLCCARSFTRTPQHSLHAVTFTRDTGPDARSYTITGETLRRASPAELVEEISRGLYLCEHDRELVRRELAP